MSIKMKIFSLFLISVFFFILGFSSVWIEKGTENIYSILFFPQKNNESVIRTTASVGSIRSEANEKAIEDAKSVLGSHLSFQFTGNGLLISVHGKRGEGVKDPHFNIKSDRSIRDRADFVLEKIKALLPYNSGLPLEFFELRKGEKAADVIYRQKLDRAFFARYGSVEINFGPYGEVISILSDYIPSVSLKSRFIKSADEAKLSWMKSHSEEIDSSKVKGSRKIIWIVGKDAFRAYEFDYQGKNYIINAETGRLLFSK